MVKKAWCLLLMSVVLTGCWQQTEAPTRNQNEGTENINMNMNSVEEGWEEYRNETFKFTVQHPQDCKIDADKFGVTFMCGKEEIVFVRQMDIPRIPLMENSIEDIMVSGISAKLYHDTDNKTGAQQDVVIFDIPGSEDDFYMRGKGEIFDKMIERLQVEK